MANTFSSSLMPRILAGALAVLREEVAFAKNMSKDYEGAAGHLGQVVSVAVPTGAASTYAVTPAAVPPALTDATQNSRLITINNWYGTRFSFTPKEFMEFDFTNSKFVPNAIAEAARAQARLINQSIAALYTKIPNMAGTVSSRLFASNIDGLSDVRTRLNYQLCPDANRTFIMSLADENDAMKLDDVKRNPQMAGDHEVYRKAFLGRIYDIDLVRDRDVKTSGAAGAGKVGTATCAAVLKGATTISVTMSAGGSDSLALNAGDIFMIDGDPATTGGDSVGAASQAYRQMYTTASVVSIGNGATGTITLDHPLPVALIGTETISIATGQGAGTVNIAGDLSGFGLVMRTPPSSIEGAPTIGLSVDMTDPVSGIPMKLSYLPGYHAAQWELSTLWGVDIVDWRRLTRVYSKS